MLCKNLITKTEGQEMRQRRKAREKDQFIRKQMEKMGKLKGKKKPSGKENKKDKNQSKNKGYHQDKKEQKPVVFLKEKLTKEQKAVKTTLIRGGIFDNMGNKYERNRK